MRPDLIDLPVPKHSYHRSRYHSLCEEAWDRIRTLIRAGRTLDGFDRVSCFYSRFEGLHQGWLEVQRRIERWAEGRSGFGTWLVTPEEAEATGLAICTLVDPSDDSRAIEWAFQVEVPQQQEFSQGEYVEIELPLMARVDGRFVDQVVGSFEEEQTEAVA